MPGERRANACTGRDPARVVGYPGPRCLVDLVARLNINVALTSYTRWIR